MIYPGKSPAGTVSWETLFWAYLWSLPEGYQGIGLMVPGD
jgi:hypothetical protein